MTDPTYMAKRIMEVFRYFRIRQGDTMTLKLFLSRRHLWKEFEEEQVKDALNELIQRGFIVGVEEPAGRMEIIRAWSTIHQEPEEMTDIYLQVLNKGDINHEGDGI
jgi:hypothetical protein